MAEQTTLLLSDIEEDKIGENKANYDDHTATEVVRTPGNNATQLRFVLIATHARRFGVRPWPEWHRNSPKPPMSYRQSISTGLLGTGFRYITLTI